MHSILQASPLASADSALILFASGPAAEAKSTWLCVVDSKPKYGFPGGTPALEGSSTTLSAGLARLHFLAAALGLFCIGIPSNGWPFLVIFAVAASIILYVLHFSVSEFLPLLLVALLLSGVYFIKWNIK